MKFASLQELGEQRWRNADPRYGAQGVCSVVSREGRAHGVGTGCSVWRASDDNPPINAVATGRGRSVFARGDRAGVPVEVSEEPVRDLYVTIGEFAVADDFLSGNLKPWIGTWGAG